jgi:thiol:disulfide interchange protein DsbD
MGGEGGVWSFLALAVAAGLGALLMPCVYPMLPLTVSFFTRQGGSRAEATRLALLYGLSIVATFTLLGLVLAVVIGAAGAQAVAANPWVNLFIAAVFVLFGLSLLGVFELKLPSALVNASARGERKGGVAGVLFMGLTLTLVSFSCTVPFVGGLLAATVTGSWVRPVLGMLAFSITFALPFVAFALFPRWLARLPKSGTWMNTLKVTLGFVELVAALKFLSNADLVWGWGLITRPLAIAVSAVLLALCGLFLVGLIGVGEEERPRSVGAGRLLSASAFLACALYLIPGLWGAGLGLFDAYLPPRSATDFSVVGAASASANPSSAHATWPRGLSGLEQASAQAQAEGRKVFIDFTGYTCTNCRAMESTVFPLAEVQAALGAFVPVALYTDAPGEGAALSRFQLEQTATVALPTYAIYDPVAERVVAHTSGMQSAEEFVAFLERHAG